MGLLVVLVGLFNNAILQVELYFLTFHNTWLRSNNTNRSAKVEAQEHVMNHEGCLCCGWKSRGSIHSHPDVSSKVTGNSMTISREYVGEIFAEEPVILTDISLDESGVLEQIVDDRQLSAFRERSLS
jgi:hypothetical protein